MFVSAEVWDWTLQCPDVRKAPSFNKEKSERVFQELLICGFIVVWGGALHDGMWSHKKKANLEIFFASEWEVRLFCRSAVLQFCIVWFSD